MNISKILVVLPALGVVFAVGLFVYAKFSTRNVADPEQLTRDPLLKQLQSQNPHLRIVEEFSRLPVYWIKVGAEQKVMFPKSEAAGARIRVRECDSSAIPQHLLYPRRVETVCVEIDNDNHVLSAFYFRTKDRLKDVVAFYEVPLDSSRRFGTSRSQTEERREERIREDGSREFLFSYFLSQRVDLMAFVGYREERKPEKSTESSEN